MKPFDFYLRFMSMMGIWRKDNSLQEKLIGMLMNCVFMCLYSIFLITTGWFFFFTAEKFAEFTECFYSLICAIIIPMFYLKLFWQKKTFDMYFTYLNAIIEESVFKLRLRAQKFYFILWKNKNKTVLFARKNETISLNAKIRYCYELLCSNLLAFS